jgi:NTP pyrophosphatase (non-canonical NTP hydrolase)
MTHCIETIVNQIADANTARNYYNLDRRMLKLIEELGELSEAFLECTSLHNHKQKGWVDVKEEAADVLIVAVDIALTIDWSSSLTEYVTQNLHRSNNYGINTLIREICYAMARFDGCFKLDHEAAFDHIATAVCYAFSLNQLVHRNADNGDALLAEVNRKLNKWRSGTSTAEMATEGDCTS